VTWVTSGSLTSLQGERKQVIATLAILVPTMVCMQGQEGVYLGQYCFNDCAKHIIGKRRARGPGWSQTRPKKAKYFMRFAGTYEKWVPIGLREGFAGFQVGVVVSAPSCHQGTDARLSQACSTRGWLLHRVPWDMHVVLGMTCSTQVLTKAGPTPISKFIPHHNCVCLLAWTPGHPLLVACTYGIGLGLLVPRDLPSPFGFDHACSLQGGPSWCAKGCCNLHECQGTKAWGMYLLLALV